MNLARQVTPEWLDALPAHDPRAAQSRRDIERLNAWMKHDRILAAALAAAIPDPQTPRLVELGAGGGGSLLRVARRLRGRWTHAEATLVDCAAVFEQRSRAEFAALGWRVHAVTNDALAWLREASAAEAEIVVTNLFLHQFATEQVREFFFHAARLARVVVAVEPRRGLVPLLFSQLVGLIGCGPVTRHDAPVSVRAGFTGGELTALWPDRGNWQLTERRAGLFSHRFVARRRSGT